MENNFSAPENINLYHFITEAAQLYVILGVMENKFETSLFKFIRMTNVNSTSEETFLTMYRKHCHKYYDLSLN